MMTVLEIHDVLMGALPGAEIVIKGDDGVHFEALIVASQFEGLSLVKRQQQVYAVLNDWIRSGRLHAIALKTYTPNEWASQGGASL